MAPYVFIQLQDNFTEHLFLVLIAKNAKGLASSIVDISNIRETSKSDPSSSKILWVHVLFHS